MTKWSMVIDLEKCVACQACSVACRMENNTPVVSPEEAQTGRSILWNDVFPMPVNPTEETGEYPNVKTQYMTRPCMHCENAPCTKVCPVGATFINEEGLVEQNYDRCIGCRFCTVACPYGVRYFNWLEPEWNAPIVSTVCIRRAPRLMRKNENFAPMNTSPLACKPARAKRVFSAIWMIPTARFRN